MKQPPPIEKRWSGLVVVAASGPSLTPEIAELCRGFRCVAVNDAYKLLPWADVLYAADYEWWRVHDGCPNFIGEKITPATNSSTREAIIARYNLRAVAGVKRGGFSFDPALIHFGEDGGKNSGFQAINLALLFGGNPIVCVGFDMRAVDGKKHFFGDHPEPLNQRQSFDGWIASITKAAAVLASDITIINATPGSALKCFPIMSLAEALAREDADGVEARHAA